MGLGVNNKKVPFDLKHVPDGFLSTDVKLFWGFPDTVGRGSKDISTEVWVHDDYLIQFDDNYLYFVNIITRDYGSISFQNIQLIDGGLTWLTGSLNASRIVQPQLLSIMNQNREAYQYIQAYLNLVYVITETVMFQEDTELLNNSKDILERGCVGLRLEGRKWKAEGREITWGKVIYSIIRSFGIQKL